MEIHGYSIIRVLLHLEIYNTSSIIKEKGGILMEINSIMSNQLAQLQQTLQMTIMDKTLDAGAGVVEMLQEMPTPAAEHPYKGQLIDLQV